MRHVSEVLAEHGIDIEGEGAPLLEALLSREDEVADSLRIAGVQFGLHTEIVAEVLTNGVILGHQQPDEVRQYVRSAFIAHMEELRRQFNEGNDNN